MSKIILKNDSGDPIQILRRDVPDQGQYEIPHYFWDELADNEDIKSKVTSGDIIVNNGNEDLSSEIGLAHIVYGVKKVCEDMEMFSGGGENAPGFVEINGSLSTLSVDIGDKFYSNKRIDGIVGEYVNFRFYLCVNNSESDKWGQARIQYTTTTGNMDKQMNAYDGYAIIGPVEVPTTPYLIFSAEVTIPTSEFQNDEKLLFVSVERETPTGKDSLNSPFYVLKYELEYWKKVYA